MRLERTLRVGLENDRRKGRKLPESGASDSSTISIASTGAAAACLRRPAWRKLPARTLGIDPQFQRLTFGVPSRAKRLPHYRKYRKYRKFLGCSQDPYGREA